MFGAFWTHDGSAQDPNALGRGNRWVIAGIVVELPFCAHPVCLPVLFRLWRGKGTPSPVRLAGRADFRSAPRSFRNDTIHGVGDAAYHGKALLVESTTFTTRLPANAVLYAPAPPRTGKRGRPRLKGHRLGIPAELAATADWRRVTVSRYGHRDTVEVAEIRRPLVRRVRHTSPAASCWSATPAATRSWRLFTTDRRNGVERVVARYAHRWPIETAIAAGKQLLGIGQARNRLQPRGRTHRAVRVHRLQPRHRLVHAARPPPRRPRRPTPPPSPGTGTRTTSPSKTCSPNSAEPLSQHELQALPQLSPTPANTATTNWPAPQPPRNCETQDGWLLKNMVRNRCGASTCELAGRLGDVELGHEFAVGGAGGGEVLVAFFELQP